MNLGIMPRALWLRRTMFRVRAYECDSLGHVNNAVYIQYVHQATLDALGVADDRGEGFWSPRALAVEYHAPTRYGDILTVTTWVLDADDLRVTRAYTIGRGADDARVASARIVWEYRDRATHAPRSVSDEHRAAATDRPAPLNPFVAPGDDGARPFRWRHTVRRYELDATDRVDVAVYFNWLEETTFRAAHVVGWSLEKMRAANVITLQHRHDAEFLGTASNGDEVEIVSRLIDVRRVRGTWIHKIYRLATNTLLVRDYSTGTFLDRDGKVRVPPKAMMDALVRGEPTGRDA